ncbi:MAG: peptide chain release factor N(5)-glutamine methyltransferase [Coraliomargarita sp.]
MLTIRDIQQRTVGFFESKGVPNAKLDTDLLIAHSLGVKRLELYLDLERPLTEAQLDVLRPLVKRRANREPLQYILGSVEFYDLTLKVDSRALIPRPETEELIEYIGERLSEAPERILDLGTGTGALALALAKKYPEAEVTAVDLSADALALAQENAEATGLADRVRFLQGSWFAPVPEGEQFDLIVSNPPYLTEAEMTTAEPEVIDHEPESALVSGLDGLDDLRIILGEAPRYLKPDGLLAVETGIEQHEVLAELVLSAGLKNGRSQEDLSGRPRFFFTQAD